MIPATHIARHRLLAPLLALIAALLLATATHADQRGPDVGQWEEVALDGFQGERWRDAHGDSWMAATADALSQRLDSAAATAQTGPTCAEADTGDPNVGLLFSDADLVAESDGSRLCIFFDYRWESYEAWLLNQRSIEEFRRTKALLQPLLPTIGIDPCHVAFWTSFDRQLRRQITLDDRYDAGQNCTPEVRARGTRSEQRADEIADSIAASAAAAAEVFGWRLSWPLRVYAYDTHQDFVEGYRREGGNSRATTASLTSVRGVSGILANGQFGYLLSTSLFPDVADLRMLVAHEFAHIAQFAIMGRYPPDVLPFFVVEGSAEYFASLVVGPEQRDLAGRFWEAIGDERTGRAVALRDLVDEPADDDQTRTFAAYSRGYAAMRLLTARWGRDSIARLHRESVGGTPSDALQALRRTTGLTLDALDAELSAYLLAEAKKPITVGRVSYAANTRLVQLGTARPVSSTRIAGAERFSRTDAAVYIALAWECLAQPVTAQIRIFGPERQSFASGVAQSRRSGCDVAHATAFPLGEPINGRIARSLPGTWTAEIYVDGVLQGTVTFEVE